MKKRNIFQNQSQEILALFERAKDRSKVMCIPMDYAKKDHVVMFCNGDGKTLRKPFSIKNSPEGVEDLVDQGIPPFSPASLMLMENRFSIHQIRRRKPTTLSKFLAKQGLHNPERRAEKLQSYATQVLKPQKDHIVTLQLALKQQISLILCLQESTDQLEQGIAEHLAQIPGAFLTTVRGIGLILAAGVSSEIGDPTKQKSLEGLVSYAGIIPQVKQSGGEQGKTQVGKVSKRCNHILKNYVVQAGLHMGIHGPEELIADYKRRDAREQHADFGMARRFLRMAMCLMKTHQFYLPKRLRNQQCKKEERARYYHKAWPLIMDKWRRVKMLDVAFDKKMPLGQWRNMLQELYGIDLSL